MPQKSKRTEVRARAALPFWRYLSAQMPISPFPLQVLGKGAAPAAADVLTVLTLNRESSWLRAFFFLRVFSLA
jgi:hypothetical protein